MSIIADGHIHIYPSFDLESLIINGHRKLLSFGEAKSYLFFAVEPNGQLEFDNIVRRVSGNISVSPMEDSAILKLSTPHGNNLYIVAGRQIVTKERLEFLALFCKRNIPDGLSVEELVAAVKKSRGILVLNWAPGKWMFKRAKIVKEILTKYTPMDLIICDTALRFSAEPKLMQAARAKGFKIIAGSDPFPLPDEESRVGQYGFKCEQDLDFRTTLLQGNLKIIGQRLKTHQAIAKVLSLMIQKRRAKQ